jgi:diacylglycerol kinase
MKPIMASFAAAFAGIASSVKTEQNMRIHLLATIAVVALGVVFELNCCEWVTIVFSCALVLTMETMNTAIEAAVDLASPNIHPLAKKAKDCAAGAVLLSVFGTVCIGVIVFIPKLVAALSVTK